MVNSMFYLLHMATINSLGING